MKKQMIVLLLLLIGLFAWTSIATAKTWYVRSYKAFLLNAPKYGAKKISLVKKNEAVEETDIQGNWLKVKAKGREGWISKLVLTTSVSNRKISLLSQKIDITSKARRRASTYSSTASARGLVESGRKRIGSTQEPDYTALKKLEEIIIDEKEAVSFLVGYSGL